MEQVELTETCGLCNLQSKPHLYVRHAVQFSIWLFRFDFETIIKSHLCKVFKTGIAGLCCT